MRIVCKACGEHYPPKGGGHCMSCHKTFTADSAFDAHRVGKYQPDERHCLTTGEMIMAGWRFTPRGWTPHRTREVFPDARN